MSIKNRIIITHEENCVGCMICQMKCSFLHNKEFNPTISFIRIDLSKITPKITFLDGCTNCCQCASHCLYDALEIKEEAI